jgi:hypothetical protein
LVGERSVGTKDGVAQEPATVIRIRPRLQVDNDHLVGALPHAAHAIVVGTEQTIESIVPVSRGERFAGTEASIGEMALPP